MAIDLDGIEMRAAGWSEICSTAIYNASAYVVVVISVLESRTLLVASSYLANLSGRTAASHLHSHPRTRGVLVQRIIEQMPGQTHARACLLDHAAELRDALAELGDEEVTVEVSERALDQAARVWSSTTDG